MPINRNEIECTRCTHEMAADPRHWLNTCSDLDLEQQLSPMGRPRNCCKDPGARKYTQGREKRCSVSDFVIDRTGYSGVEDTCIFLEIKRVRDGIEAFSECTEDAPNGIAYSYVRATFQIVGKRLKFQVTKTKTVHARLHDTGDVHDYDCVEVKPTPDGVLNVRQGPGMDFKIKGKLLPGQRVKMNHYTSEWVHFKGVCESDEKLNGWVYGKYLDIKAELFP